MPFTPFATGLILNHSLCSCQGARLLPSRARTLKTIQTFETLSFNSDPLRRCASCATCSLAFALAFSCFAACAASLTDVVLLNGHPHRPWNELPHFCFRFLPRKEVIQPHLPIRLPCYDFTPGIGLALGGWLLAVASPTLGTPNSHGVTGGVYKARERIHRGMLIRDY